MTPTIPAAEAARIDRATSDFVKGLKIADYNPSALAYFAYSEGRDDEYHYAAEQIRQATIIHENAVTAVLAALTALTAERDAYRKALEEIYNHGMFGYINGDPAGTLALTAKKALNQYPSPKQQDKL